MKSEKLPSLPFTTIILTQTQPDTSSYCQTPHQQPEGLFYAKDVLTFIQKELEDYKNAKTHKLIPPNLLLALDFVKQLSCLQFNMTGLQHVYRHVDLGPGETMLVEREGHAVGLVIHHSMDTDHPTCNPPTIFPTHTNTAFCYRIAPTHHSAIGLIGSPCVDPSPVATEPAAGQHHSSALLGVWRFKAYRHSHPLDEIQNDLNFMQPGPIYVVTHGTQVGFFPSLSIAQEFTLHVSSNAWKKCNNMHEAFDYYSRIYNETSRGLLGVQVLPAMVVSANPLIDESHPLNQDDVVLSMHRNGRVTIEREPADGNPHYPIDDLPAYSYREALVAAFEEQGQDAASGSRSFALPSGPIVISDSDSDGSTSSAPTSGPIDIDIDADEEQYNFAGDLSSLTQVEYNEIEAIEQSLMASQQTRVDYNEEEAVEQALRASLSQE
ncbi:hypothetical protein BT96DRAFT_996812 [Gymnopus androsaceus JB14]|uniref:Uncharacterized protein n=1 Tax=Gymnopus androsaceus JB14 TaxID=1447944 RepID=A0A6A4HGH6_9AGAR|nr:hypothetical protein BT96DRAFT_996812 [Gymnopus androsaceus JB14]